MRPLPLLLLLANGCAGPGGPAGSNLILVCDPTGAQPACVEDTVRSEAAAWFRDGAAFRPGVDLVVITPAAMGNTAAKVWPAVSVPEARPKEYRTWGAWAEATADGLSFDLDGKEEPGRGRPASDVIGAIQVAVSIAQSDMAGEPVELAVATDGWLVGSGFDLDGSLRRPRWTMIGKKGRTTWVRPALPAVEDAVAALPESPLGWTLTGFSSIRLCGLSPSGDPAKIAKRNAAWAAILQAGGPATLPVPTTSCKGGTRGAR